MAECLAKLFPIRWKTELLINKLGHKVEISKQNTEGVAWVLLAALVKCQRINSVIQRLFQEIRICLTHLKQTRGPLRKGAKMKEGVILKGFGMPLVKWN